MATNFQRWQYAEVAEWQTRWIQNPVPDKGVWVQVPPSVLSSLSIAGGADLPVTTGRLAS